MLMRIVWLTIFAAALVPLGALAQKGAEIRCENIVDLQSCAELSQCVVKRELNSQSDRCFRRSAESPAEDARPALVLSFNTPSEAARALGRLDFLVTECSAKINPDPRPQLLAVVMKHDKRLERDYETEQLRKDVARYGGTTVCLAVGNSLGFETKAQ